MGILKTGYQLLALSMENMVEHIIQRLRASPDEDLYRILTTLLYEAFQQTFLRLSSNAPAPAEETAMNVSLQKVSEILSSNSPNNSKYKEAFDRDFIVGKPTISQIIFKLGEWRARLQENLALLPKTIQLENYSRYLVEFEYQKYEDVEIPGQYLNLSKDSNNDFFMIDRFEPSVAIVKRHGSSFRRLGIRATDGKVYFWLVQNPAARHSRREERMVQLLRFLSTVLERRKETNRRNLTLSTPMIIPLSAHVRIVSDGACLESLEELLEGHLSRGPTKQSSLEEIILWSRDELIKRAESVTASIPPVNSCAPLPVAVAAAAASKRASPEMVNIKTDVFEEVSHTLVPPSILSTYYRTILADCKDFWIWRQEFTQQYASSCFITYILSIAHRLPHKVLIDASNGKVFMSDLLPSTNHLGLVTLNEAVPFRLGPNVQSLIGPWGLEGPFVACLEALGEALDEGGLDFEVENYFALAIRDELQSCSSVANPMAFSNNSNELDILSKTIHNVDIILKRVQTMAATKDRERYQELQGPVNQAIVDLVSSATNPQKLCQMDPHWHPWL